MVEQNKNKVDEIIDDASLILATSKTGTIIASKIAKEELPRTKRYKVADKIGKLIKELSS